MKIRTELAPDGLRYCFTALDSPFLVQLLGHTYIQSQNQRPAVTVKLGTNYKRALGHLATFKPATQADPSSVLSPEVA